MAGGQTCGASSASLLKTPRVKGRVCKILRYVQISSYVENRASFFMKLWRGISNELQTEATRSFTVKGIPTAQELI